MAKRGRKGQKKVQGQKAKKAATKAKGRKTQAKAVKTNLKKMSFENRKKTELLNEDITKVLTAPSKVKAVLPPKQKRKSEDEDMPDVGSLSTDLASM